MPKTSLASPNPIHLPFETSQSKQKAKQTKGAEYPKIKAGIE